MSTFRRRFLVTVDGQDHELTSRPADFLAAERYMAREKISNPQENAPLQLQLRIVYAMWGRAFPDHPASRDWPKFLDVLDEVADLDQDAGDPLTPTQPAESASSP